MIIKNAMSAAANPTSGPSVASTTTPLQARWNPVSLLIPLSQVLEEQCHHARPIGRLETLDSSPVGQPWYKIRPSRSPSVLERDTRCAPMNIPHAFFSCCLRTLWVILARLATLLVDFLVCAYVALSKEVCPLVQPRALIAL